VQRWVSGIDQGLAEFSGVLLEGFGQLHGCRDGQIAVGGLLGRLENGGQRGRGIGRHGAQGLTEGRQEFTLSLDHPGILRGGRAGRRAQHEVRNKPRSTVLFVL
jgi:hypothetical protein